jgi:hypothetical protein
MEDATQHHYRSDRDDVRTWVRRAAVSILLIVN